MVKDLGAVPQGMGRGAALHRLQLVRGAPWGANSLDLQVCRPQTWESQKPRAESERNEMQLGSVLPDDTRTKPQLPAK